MRQRGSAVVADLLKKLEGKVFEFVTVKHEAHYL